MPGPRGGILRLIALSTTLVPSATTAPGQDDLPEGATVRSVEVEGVERFRMDEAREAIRIGVGEPLRDEAVEAARERILSKYHRDGFAFAEVEVAIEPRPLGGAALRFIVYEGHRVRLSEVEVIGNETIPDRELIDASGLEPVRLLGLLSRGYYTPGSIDEALDAMLELYQSRGRIEAWIGIEEMELDARKRRLRVRVRVIEGPRYRVGRVEIRGRAAFPEEILRREIGIEPGEHYSGADVRAGGIRLARWYLEHSDLIPSVRAYPPVPIAPGEVAVVYEIEEGKPRFVGEVAIAGNWKTRDRVVRRLLDVEPGEVLVPFEIEESAARLRASGLFERAEIRMEGTPDPQVVDVEVEVTEKERSGYFELGGGASSGAGEVAYVRVESNNFDLFRLPRSLTDWRGAFTGGGQVLRIEAIPGSRESDFRVLFREPYFLSARNALSIRGAGAILERTSYDETRLGGEVEVRRFLDDDDRHLSAALAYRIENVSIDDIVLPAPPDVAAAEGHRFLSFPRLSILYDDLEINPYAGPRGVVADLGVDFGHSALGSELDFTRLTASADVFLGLFGRNPDYRHTLRAGIHAGWVEDLGSGPVPISERFFVGGPRSFRGFDYRGVGPHQLDTPIGGEVIVRGTLQYSLPLLFREVRAVAVFDWGNLESDIESFSTGRFRTAAGGGLELRLPFPLTGQVVPMNLYWVQALASEDEDEEQLFTFTLGFGF